MPLTNPYTTLLRVQKETRNSKPDKVEWLETCINDASRIIDDFTNRTFFLHDHTAEPLEVQPAWVVDKEIYLPFPIVSLDSISVEGETLPATDWRTRSLSLNGAVGHVNSSWVTAGRSEGGCRSNDPYERPILLTGTFGYEAPDTETPSPALPASITRAATLIAAALSGLNQKEVLTLEGDRDTQAEYRIPSEAKMLLKRFKRHNS